MNGWRYNDKGRRVTRRERKLPKLRGFAKGDQGNKALPRDATPQHRCHMRPSVITIHRHLIKDLYRQLARIKAGRHCWAPPRWQLAMLEEQNGQS